MKICRIHCPAKGKEVFRQILALRGEVEQSIMGIGKWAATAHQALNLLYRRPVIDASDLERELAVSTPTANALIKSLRNKGILVETTGQQRRRVYTFERYLSLFLS